MSPIAWSVVLVCTAAGLLVAWWQRKIRVAQGLPGWPALPLIGNLHQLIGDNEYIFRRMMNVAKIAEEANMTCRVWFGPKLAYVFVKPEEIKIVTNTFVEKPFYLKFAGEWLGEGLVTASVPVWKKHIKLLGSTFSTGVVDGYQDIFHAQTLTLVGRLRSHCGAGPFDAMHSYLAPATLEIVCQTALGVPAISQSIATTEYTEAFNQTLDLIMRRAWNPAYHVDWLYHLTSDYKRFKRSVKIIHNVSQMVLQKRKMARALATQEENSNSDGGNRKFRPLIDILLDLQSAAGLSDEEIRAEVDTTIVGGQETTASTMLLTLLMLGTHPRVQQNVYEEIYGIFGESDRAVEKEDLCQMPYTEMVIKETLRLYPPAPLVLRAADRDLPLEGFTIQKGAYCAVCIWGAGRSRRVWGADAALFRPERWLDAPPAHPAGFAAFSYGRRSCIGKVYAMALLKTTVANVVRHLELISDAKKLQFKADLVLRPIRGHLLQVRPRDRKTTTRYLGK